jgi:HPt (histidine-containing phosphotransfer) domain-containing protein
MESSSFDYAAALAGMDQEIIEIIAPVFLEHQGSELAALRQSIASSDAATAIRHAHGLKGTLAAFGAQPAERRAAEIEALAKAGDFGQMGALLDDLEMQVAELVKALRAAGFSST